jgi:malonyl-CoA O-methyltransferase
LGISGVGAEQHQFRPHSQLGEPARGLTPGVLSASEGYRRWAPHYDAETVISFIEDALVSWLTPCPSKLRLLDAGCGTGRRLAASGARRGIGVDACREMIALCRPRETEACHYVLGDVRALPVADRSVDLIWCRLVLGHLPEIDAAYRELARAVVRRGTVVVSDFHAAAWDAGHRRTFRDADGIHEIVHFVHDAEAHRAAAERAGLATVAVREGAIGPNVRHFYESSGRTALYRQHLGLPVVLALRFEREG